MRYQAPDGHGRYGVLDTDEHGRLICHECGGSYAHLGTHVRQAHGIMPAEYRQAHGLGYSRRLVSESTSDNMRKAWTRHAESHMAALETHRDVHRARSTSPVGHAGSRGTSRPEVLAGYQQRGRARRGRDLTADEREMLGDGLDLQHWADAARVLLERPGVSLRSVGDAASITPSTVGQRLRRYPPREQQEPS